MGTRKAIQGRRADHNLDQETRNRYQERAAIMEFHGGLSRDEAERLAWLAVVGRGRGRV